jgi:hypothetical protein
VGLTAVAFFFVLAFSFAVVFLNPVFGAFLDVPSVFFRGMTSTSLSAFEFRFMV